MNGLLSFGLAIGFLALITTVVVGVRFVAFLVLLIEAEVTSVSVLICDKGRSRCLAIFAVVFSAWLASGLVAKAPHFSFNGPEESINLIHALAKPAITVSHGVSALRLSQGDPTADDSVLRWKDALVESPVYSIVRSAARTLFAPYPWVAISPGLNWVSFSELYYPGVVFWILCVPGVFAELVSGLQQRELGFWLLALFLAVLVAAYTIWLGEWSTRQRVFALPAFFAFAAMGRGQLFAWAPGPRTALASDHKA